MSDNRISLEEAKAICDEYDFSAWKVCRNTLTLVETERAARKPKVTRAPAPFYRQLEHKGRGK